MCSISLTICLISDCKIWSIQLLTFCITPLCFRRDEEDLSQWQCEFRGQIRALRQWLKSMEMRLPPLDPRVSWVYCLSAFCCLSTFHSFSVSPYPMLKLSEKHLLHVFHPIFHPRWQHHLCLFFFPQSNFSSHWDTMQQHYIITKTQDCTAELVALYWKQRCFELNATVSTHVHSDNANTPMLSRCLVYYANIF